MRPAKKRKEPTPPIVFNFADHDVDVRFKVFDDLEFHVHSVVLRMYSAFFRRFLDSPDKDGRDENTGKFKYEWATKYDADGSWSLVDARSLTADQVISHHQPINFANVLLYRKTIKITMPCQRNVSYNVFEGCTKRLFETSFVYFIENLGQSTISRT